MDGLPDERWSVAPGRAWLFGGRLEGGAGQHMDLREMEGCKSSSGRLGTLQILGREDDGAKMVVLNQRADLGRDLKTEFSRVMERGVRQRENLLTSVPSQPISNICPMAL